MTRMLIHGREANPVHLLMLQLDVLEEAYKRYPKGHPERGPLEVEHNRLAGELLFHRRGSWVAA